MSLRALRGVRTRILLYAVALLALGIAVTILTARQILIVRLDDQIDNDLVQEAREFRQLAGGIDPRTGRPFGESLASLFDAYFARNSPTDDGSTLAYVGGRFYREQAFEEYALDRSARLGLQQRLTSHTDTLASTVDTEKGPLRFLAVPVSAQGGERGSLVIASLVDERRGEIDEAVQTAAIVGAIVLLGGALLSFLAIGRVLGPLRELTDTARTISHGDLTRRIEVHGDDELAELGTTFNAMLDRLEIAFASQRHLIREVGHELRTPITIVRGHLELLGDDPAEREATIELVIDELDRMGRLVEDLSTLARAERPDFLHPEPVQVSALAAEVLAKARPLAERHWQLDVPTEGGALLLADPQRLTQALVNLTDNAIRHTEPGGTITLGAEIDDAAARLWVADDGPGISGDEAERIFDLFARGTGEPRYAGTGLGLAIVKAIAEAHMGRVEIDSEPGSGARFTIVIAAATAADWEPAVAP